mgnify:CR=1 FL=1
MEAFDKCFQDEKNLLDVTHILRLQAILESFLILHQLRLRLQQLCVVVGVVSEGEGAGVREGVPGRG